MRQIRNCDEQDDLHPCSRLEQSERAQRDKRIRLNRAQRRVESLFQAHSIKSGATQADKLNYVTWEELGPLCSCVPQVSHAPSRLTFAGEGCKGSFKGYLSSLLPTAHA